MSTGILSLPTDVFSKICTFIEKSDILQLRKVTNSFLYISNNEFQVSKLTNELVFNLIGYCKIFVRELIVSSKVSRNFYYRSMTLDAASESIFQMTDNKIRLTLGIANPRHFFLCKIFIVPIVLKLSGLTQDTRSSYNGSWFMHRLHMQLSVGQARGLFKHMQPLFQNAKFLEMRIEGNNQFDQEIMSQLSNFLDGKSFERIELFLPISNDLEL